MTSYRERKPSASRRAGLAALGALTLASCIADNRPYPARWGERPTVAEHTCSDIAGSYAGCEIDKGDRIPQCLNFLGPVVNVESSPGQYSATSDPHAKIEQTANQMRISLYADDQQLGERVFLKDRKDGFSCTTEGIAVSNGSEAIQHDFYMPGTYTMIKDKEGHLIVKYHESGGGLGLGIIPAAVSNTDWRRLDPYVSQSPAERQRIIAELQMRFESTDQGTVIDSLTGLEWTQTDSENEVSVLEAQRWCNGHGAGWRLPTGEELQAIYDSSGTLSTRCRDKICNVSPKFHLNFWWFWTADPNPYLSTGIFYNRARLSGYEKQAEYESAKYNALCVRHP